ncbi:MAG: hypothetical protein M1821_006563, partial [Bathelium mastoideum]
IIITAIVFSLLAVIAVALRIWARFKTKTSIGIDDYLIVLALGCAVAYDALTIAEVTDGNLGGHILPGPDGKPVLDSSLVFFFKYSFISEQISIFALAFSKLSILCFYRRVFPVRRFKMICWTLITIVILWGISFFFASLFECYPPSEFWKSFFGQSGVKCYDYKPMFLATVVSNMVIDVCILTTPMPMIWKLQMPVRQKVALSAVFFMGAFIVAVSITRIYFFFEVVHSKSFQQAADITHTYARPILWTQIEVSSATICACLPTLNPLFKQVHFSNMGQSLASKLSWMSLRTKGSGSQPSVDKGNLESFKTSSSLENLMREGSRGVILNDIRPVSLTEPPSPKLDTVEGIRIKKSFGTSGQFPNSDSSY